MPLFASIKLLSEIQFGWAISWAGSYVHWQGWNEMGPIFSPQNVGQLFSYYYISEHIYTEKQQDNCEDNGSKHMEGMVQ